MTTLEQLQFEAQQFAAATRTLDPQADLDVIRKQEYEMHILKHAFDQWLEGELYGRK